MLTHHLASCGIDQNAFLCKTILGGPVTKKMWFFLWKVNRGSIKMIDVLIKKASWIVSAPNWCVLCHQRGQSIMHVLVFCDYAQSFCVRILLCFNYQVVFPNDPFSSWVCFLLVIRSRITKQSCGLSTSKHYFGSSSMNVIIVSIEIERHNSFLFYYILYTSLSCCKFTTFF